MKRKGFIAAAVMACCAAAFGESFFAGKPLYVKLLAGYQARTVKVPYGVPYYNWDDGSYSYSEETTDDAIGMFALKPSVGMKLFPQDENLFKKGLAAEVSLDFAFGTKGFSGYDATAFVLTPGARALWSYEVPNTKFAPYTGLGISIPIQIVKSEWDYAGLSKDFSKTSGGFDIDWSLGCCYGITEKISIAADWTLSFGTSFANAFCIGAVYRL